MKINANKIAHAQGSFRFPYAVRSLCGTKI